MPITVAALTSAPETSDWLRRSIETPDSGISVVVVPNEPDLAVREILRADVALLDHQLSRATVLRMLRTLLILPCRAERIIVQAPRDPAIVIDYLQWGAGGYVLEGASPSRIIERVRAASEGDVCVDPWLVAHLVARYRDMRGQQRAASQDADEPWVGRRIRGEGGRDSNPDRFGG
jgi:DNA-binding NarL/FixJ family response regulator